MPQKKHIILLTILLSGFFGVTSIAQARDFDISEICNDCVVEKFAECGGFLEGATVAPDGTLWVVDLLSGNLLSVDDSGECTVEGNTGGQPNGAKHHRDGRLFIADKVRGILEFDPQTKEVSLVVNMYKNELIRGFNDLVFDSNGGFYFTEPYGSGALEPIGRVFYVPPGGNNANMVLVSGGMAFPNGIALSPNEINLYVGEYARKRITSLPSLSSEDVFDTSFVKANTEGGIGPDGMAVDAEGNIYQAIFQGGQVSVFDPNGYHYGKIWLPEDAGTFVTNVAFDGNWLYITEASQGVIWRVRTNNAGHLLWHQR